MSLQRQKTTETAAATTVFRIISLIMISTTYDCRIPMLSQSCADDGTATDGRGCQRAADEHMFFSFNSGRGGGFIFVSLKKAVSSSNETA